LDEQIQNQKITNYDAYERAQRQWEIIVNSNLPESYKEHAREFYNSIDSEFGVVVRKNAPLC